MDFSNLYAQGFARVAACTFPVALADPAANAASILTLSRASHDEGAAIALFPELSLSGYSIDDLLGQDVLLDAVEAAIVELAKASAKLTPVVVVGAPLRHGARLYNCAVVIHRGEVLGVAPKSYLPNYREFYEKRWFAAGAGHAGEFIVRPEWPGADDDGEIPFGPDLIFAAEDVADLAIGVEICEDMWVPIPPSHEAALHGATVLLNLSASPITVGRAEDRAVLARATSARCNAAYVYCAASRGESTTDLSWDGQAIAYECGEKLGASERFSMEATRLVVDVDLDRLRQERQRQGSFDDNADGYAAAVRGGDETGYRVVPFTLAPPSGDLGLRRVIDRFPFVPDDPDRLAQDCYEAYNIQVTALTQRMRAISGGDPSRYPKLILGVSGGLDSTHALLVAAAACDRLGLERTHINAVTMPGFATSDATKSNATTLAEGVGASFEEIDIRPLAEQMLADLGHPYSSGKNVYDVTFENVQAGLRTDVLFRLANLRGGIVLGTGDLSELALGWCTYGVGDQMSHYGVNAGIPKTMIQHVIRWVRTTEEVGAELATVLAAILDTEISPELIPAGDGEKPQSTQDSIGPYSLHDFTLYYVLRRGYRPSKIAYLAHEAWRDQESGLWPPEYPEADKAHYDLETIARWMEVFITRFFSQQFKRTAIPNGPKVMAGGSLSPRGDWRMPSDASGKAWIDELRGAIF